MTKEITLYRKTITPHAWDEFIITAFKSQEQLKQPNLEFTGYLDCSEKNLSMLEAYQREANAERKEMFKEQFLSFASLTDFQPSDTYQAIKSVASYGDRQQKT